MEQENFEQRHLPKYRCHKEVRAARIDRMAHNTVGSNIILGLSCGATRTVSHDWFKKHAPAHGGYFVEYEDGYTSYSPAGAFESGYTLIEAEV